LIPPPIVTAKFTSFVVYYEYHTTTCTT